MAITEHGHMGSIPDMYFTFKKHGLSPIAGCELYLNEYEPLRQQIVKAGKKISIIKEKSPALHSRIVRNRHLTVLAKNEVGFHNLVMLTTLAYDFGFYYRPRIWFDKLCEYKEGLIVLSGCLNGPVAHELRLDFGARDTDGSKVKRQKYTSTCQDLTGIDYIRKYHKEFGDNYYLEVQMPCLPDIHDYEVFWTLIDIGEELGIPAVLTNDSHYIDRASYSLQKIMMAIGQNCTVDSSDLFHVNSDEQYFKTRAELWATFKNNRYSEKVSDAKFEEICDNTLVIAERCEQLKFDTASKIPDWSTIETGQDANTELRRIVALELRRRGFDKNPRKFLIDGREVTYTEQAKIELNRFIDKGFASYFLITRDLLQHGKRQGWPFGPRGSAGGSLVCFLLNIHSLNPLLWGLSFDRFLGSSRGGYLLKVNM